MGVFSSLTLGAAELVPTGAPSSNVVTASLEYQETGYTLITWWGISIRPQSTPFAKEPALAAGKVIRGVLQFHGDASNSIPFIWHSAAGKLYLDLNRNRDLTDDAQGTFVTPGPAGAGGQTFTNIHLSFNTPSGNRQVLVDLDLYGYSHRPGCSAALRSFWQGKVTLQNQSWQVGLVEDLLDRSRASESGQLLMRPWEERNKPFNVCSWRQYGQWTAVGRRDKPFDLYSSSPEAFPFSRKLFVGGHAYQLDWINEPQGGTSKLNLQFTEQQPALGELKITGSFVQRLILQDGPYLVVLDHPESVVKAPVGQCGRLKIWLKQGEVEAWRDSDVQQTRSWISIDEKQLAVLAAGGPLTNSVSVTRHGKYLDLNYRLIGADGAVYQLVRLDRAHPPEFAIYKAGKKIASGNFQYG